MDTFRETFGFIGAICAGIIILALFFTVLSFFKGNIRGFKILKVKDFIREGQLVNVHLTGGKSVLGVRFIGFTHSEPGKGGMPYQLGSLVVLETAEGARVFLKPDTVRMIEEVSAGG